MKPYILLSILIPCFLTWAQQELPSSRLPVIPHPQQITMKSGIFKINSQTRIILGGDAAKEDSFAGDHLNAALEEIKEISLKISHEKAIRRFTANYIFLGSPKSTLGKDFLKSRGGKFTPVMKEEGYFLDIDDEGIVIIAESVRGRFYGIVTLIQLITKVRNSLHVPTASIHDWPSLHFRGISDDISRGQISTIENFKKIIRFLSNHKLNVYSPYIEDVFAFKSHPLIGNGRGALTASEVRELDEYAKQYHVEMIPTFETLGHWENIFTIPEYAKYAEFPGAHSLNVSNESIYPLLDQMIGELAQAFSSPYFNIAADESWDVGLGASKKRVQESDIASVHADHYKRLFAILKKYKKRPLMYGDILLNEPSILTKIPKDVIIVDWHYYVTDKYNSPAIFKKAGFPLIVSPAVWNFTGPFPNYLNSFVNIQRLVKEGYENNTLGVLTSNWNDYGGEAFRELNYYGYAWTAECAWSAGSTDHSSFSETFFNCFFGNVKAGKAGQTIYAVLSSPYNQFIWDELWRHPMLPPYETNMKLLWRVQSIESSMPLLRKQIEELKSQAVRNKDHIQYLEFVIDLSTWFAKKIKSGEEVKRMLNMLTEKSGKEKTVERISELLQDTKKDLQKLRGEFKNLWLTTNREAGLSLLLARYDRQIAYWEEKTTEVSKGDFSVDPLIESAWIYAPQVGEGIIPAQKEKIEKAFFKRNLQIDAVVQKGILQLVGDTHAKLYVNGKEIGEVSARRSLSLLVEQQRIRLFDVTSHLKTGENIIAVEAFNYEKEKSAGFNLYGELIHRDGSVQKILSDTTWNVTTKIFSDWRNISSTDDEWKQAAAGRFRGEVIRPNFSVGRASWIER